MDIEEFQTLKKWKDELAARPAFEKGNNVPPKEDVDEATRAKQASDWILKGQQADAKKQ